MTLSTANKDAIELRRERVAQLRLRGLSSREIALALAQGDKNGKGRMLNPETGEPYTHTTIQNDLKALKDQWRESAGVATDEHQARQLAEIQEIKRMAWQQQNGNLALQALDREMKLTGTMKQTGGINLNINIDLITKLERAVEARGLRLSDVVEQMLQDMQHAELTSAVS